MEQYSEMELGQMAQLLTRARIALQDAQQLATGQQVRFFCQCEGDSAPRMQLVPPRVAAWLLANATPALLPAEAYAAIWFADKRSTSEPVLVSAAGMAAVFRAMCHRAMAERRRMVRQIARNEAIMRRMQEGGQDA